MQRYHQFLILLLSTMLFSCNTESADPDTDTQASCSINSGYFNIIIEGQNYEMKTDANTHFTITHNYYGDSVTAVSLDALDQNGKLIDMTILVDGVIPTGTTTYPNDFSSLEAYFTVDTLSTHMYEITFDVSTSNLPAPFPYHFSTYKPIVAKFTAKTHQGYDNNGPIHKYDISGSFCLNDAIF